MKTWRERIQEARERGGQFTVADRVRAFDLKVCAIGEISQSYGLDRWDLAEAVGLGHNPYLGGLFYAHVSAGNPDTAERILDAIEDRALQLKREMGVHEDTPRRTTP